MNFFSNNLLPHLSHHAWNHTPSLIKNSLCNQRNNEKNQKYCSQKFKCIIINLSKTKTKNFAMHCVEHCACIACALCMSYFYSKTFCVKLHNGECPLLLHCVTCLPLCVHCVRHHVVCCVKIT